MKQVFSTIAFLMMITASEHSDAQNNNEIAFNSTPALSSPAKFFDKKKVEKKISNINTKAARDFIRSFKNVTETKVTSVDIKAVRDFTRSYKNVPGAKWFKSEGGYIANFLSNGIDTKIIYDEKGRWFYNLLTYTEANLPFEIRDMIKSRYYDDDIIIIYQYEQNNKTVYVVRMQDQQSNIKSLMICDGKMDDISHH